LGLVVFLVRVEGGEGWYLNGFLGGRFRVAAAEQKLRSVKLEIV
jgi:hypothetical protein